MKAHNTRRQIIHEWVALPKDKRQTEEQVQKIANAFFLTVGIFGVAFAYVLLSARAQDYYYPPERAQLHSGWPRK